MLLGAAYHTQVGGPDTTHPLPAQQCPYIPGKDGTICHHTNFSVLAVDILLSHKLLMIII